MAENKKYGELLWHKKYEKFSVYSRQNIVDREKITSAFVTPKHLILTLKTTQFPFDKNIYGKPNCRFNKKIDIKSVPNILKITKWNASELKKLEIEK